MQLNLQQIQMVTQGAEMIREENGALRFYRFAEEELALYRARPTYWPTAMTTAGVQMEFRTDADALQLQLTALDKKLYRRYFSYDILVNERLVGQLKNFPDVMENGHYDEAELLGGPYSGSFCLGSGIKTVRIVFPWSVSLGLESICLENATFLEPVKKDKTLLIYGDSITHGACSLYPSKTYAALLAQWLDSKAINKAVGSEFYYPELAEIKQKTCPDYITVAYGINDWYHLSQEEFADRCRRFWSAICRNYPTAKKFALSPIYYLADCGERPFGPLTDVAKLVRQITKEFPDITVIDCMDFVSRDTADFGDLYVHPNHIGFQKYFENLKQAMIPHL